MISLVVMKKRTNYPSGFKTKIVLDALRIDLNKYSIE